MTGTTQSPQHRAGLGPIRLPPGSFLEPVEEADSESEDDENWQSSDSSSVVLSNVDEDAEENEGGSLFEKDSVFEKIKETLSKTQERTESVASLISSNSLESDGPHVQISDQYTSLPYGIQPRATYEHSKQQADIMGIAYNGRMRQFVILDSKGITIWKRDIVDTRDMKMEANAMPKTFQLKTTLDNKKKIIKKDKQNLQFRCFVRRALQYPKYEYRLLVNIVYAPKYNCYFALGKDFSLKVLNRDFEETCSVNADLRSVLFMLFNPVKDELITGGVGGIKVWDFCQKAGRAFQELKPLANYILEEKYTLANVGGSWVKRVDLDYYLQHLYCCSDTDLHVYDLQGTLLFKLERAHTMSITGCCFSPYAKVLITSSVDSEVKIWSLTGGLVHTFRGHSRAVTSLLLHPETSSIILTSSLDGSIRMWSLDTMDLLYMLVVSTDGVMWMGLTDDKQLYISTCRNITLWNLNHFYHFWGVARNSVTKLSISSCSSKPTSRVVAVGEDSSVRMFARSNQKNMTTVLPPPDISALQKILNVCYSREFNLAFLLITTREIWVYTTRTDPSCRIAMLDVHDLQLPYLSGKADNNNLPPGVHIQAPSTSLGPGGVSHRATENGHGNEELSNCCSLCILNSTAMMWTDEGFCCPIRHSYLLLGLEDGRILFMDPVIKGQKYMEFKASKDAIQEMRQDVLHSSLITLVRLKELALIQIWGLPHLDALYEVHCALDVTDYARMGVSFMTGHSSGHLNFFFLEQVEDSGMAKPKQEPDFDKVVDNSRRPEHLAPIVAMDTVGGSFRVFCTCSSDGAIKIWDENKFLMTEVVLDESLCAACFLNDMGDLLVGFKNHIFYIDHTKLCPNLKPEKIEMETYDQESDVYEDPTVLYEGGVPEDNPVTLDNYLVPYDIKFDKDFLEGKTKIEHKQAKQEESESETESDLSMAPSHMYYSAPESPESLSMIDLTLGSDYSKYDLYKQMESTLEYMVKKAKEDKKPKRKPVDPRLYKIRRFLQGGRKRQKQVAPETPDITDREEEDREVEKYTLPAFGMSPGPSPSITPPSGQASPRLRDEMLVVSDDDGGGRSPSDFRPIKLDKAFPQSIPSLGPDFPTPYSSYIARPIHMIKRQPQDRSHKFERAPANLKIPKASHRDSTVVSVSDSDYDEFDNDYSDNERPCSGRFSWRESELEVSDADSEKFYETKGSAPAKSGERQMAETESAAADDDDQEDEGQEKTEEGKGRRGLKGMKVDVRGLMKEKKMRRITSARAPSLTRRRSSTDHTHDDHDHDHDHHDDNRSRLKKKQLLEERKLPRKQDQTKPLRDLPPNPPSMLTRKRSLSRDSRNLELHLLQHPELHRDTDNQHQDLANIKYNDSKDIDSMQDQIWAQEASLMGIKLTLPPPKASSRAKEAKNKNQGLRMMFGENGQVEGHIPGVGSSPTAELEDDTEYIDGHEKLKPGVKDMSAGRDLANEDDEADLDNLDSQSLETQIQRTKDMEHHVDSKEWFPRDENDVKAKANVRPSRILKVYIPHPGRETPSVDAMSSHRGSLDSGMGDRLLQTPVTPPPAIVTVRQEKAESKADDTDDDVLISEIDKAKAKQRPASSFTGLRRGQLEGERLKAQRPLTAHVRFKPEMEFIVELPHQLDELQAAFQDAMEHYQSMPGSINPAEKLYRNDGTSFEENWQERVIERHILLRLQKEIRAQGAAQKRQTYESIQQDKLTRQINRCDSSVGFAKSDSGAFSMSHRARSSMSLPMATSGRPPTREKPRPRTAHPNLQKEQIAAIKSEMSQEKAFRFRINKDPPKTSRPTSSRSISTVAEFSPHWIDPRNPDAWRPKSSRSIPSKCNRFVLVNKPKQKLGPPVPSPLEEQLLAERFPKMGRKLVPNVPDNTPRLVKKSRHMEYSPFVYQRFV